MVDVWTRDSNVVSFALLLSVLVILPVFCLTIFYIDNETLDKHLSLTQ